MFQRRKNRDEIEEMIGFNPEDKYYYDDLEIRERNADFYRSIYDIAAEA